jgi:hypothetical protein
MEKVRIEATKKTPFILLDPVEGRIEIVGSSIYVDIIKFYEPILEWVEEYKQMACPITIINCRLNVYNTITTKVLTHIFKTLEKLPASKKVLINWFFEKDDYDMREFGEDIRSILKIVDFNIIENTE